MNEILALAQRAAARVGAAWGVESGDLLSAAYLAAMRAPGCPYTAAWRAAVDAARSLPARAVGTLRRPAPSRAWPAPGIGQHDRALAAVDTRDSLRAAMSRCSPVQRADIVRTFLDGLTQRERGRERGVAESSVCQSVRAGLRLAGADR